MNDSDPVAALSLDGQGTSGWIYAFANGQEIVDVSFTDMTGPWTYEVQGQMLHGRPTITHLTIAPRDAANPQAITWDTLRKVRTGTILGRVREALKNKWENKVGSLSTQARIQWVKSGRSWPAEHYMQVAWFAIEAELAGKAPRQAIEETWHVSKITASRWLARARTLGYLPDYPLAEADDRFGDRRSHATQIVEEQIVEKVLQEGFASTSGTSNVAAAISAILQRSVFGTSEEAYTLRTEIFVKVLGDLAGDCADGQIRAAAEHLFDLLADPEKAPAD